MCQRSGDGLSNTKGKLMVCGRGCAPAEHVPRAAANWEPVPSDWWPTQTKAARSASTSSSDEDARSTDEGGRLLTKRCIEKQW